MHKSRTNKRSIAYKLTNHIGIELQIHLTDLNAKCQQEENIQDVVIHHEQLLTEDTSDDICNCWTLLLAMPPLPMWRSYRSEYEQSYLQKVIGGGGHDIECTKWENNGEKDLLETYLSKVTGDDPKRKQVVLHLNNINNA